MKKLLQSTSSFTACALVLFSLSGVSVVQAATGTWSFDSTGTANWSVSSNWSGGTIADGAGFTANLTGNITAARTVTLDTSRTIGTVNIGDSGSSYFAYTLATGSNTLTFDNSGSGAQITQASTGTSDVISGKLAIGGNGNLTITTNPSYTSLTISAGITSALASGTQTLAINNGNSTGTLNLSGVIADGSTGGSIAVTKAGGGTTTISNANTYSGGTTLSVGTLNINNAQALGTGAFTITGGTFNNSTASAITLANNNAQFWNGNFTFGGTRALDMGTGAVSLGANTTATVNGSGATALSVDGNISGTGMSLTKAGAGTLILSGTNSYNGGTVINGGTLQFNSAAAIAGTGNNVLINYGGAAAFGYALDQATLTGRIVAGSRGTVALAADTSNNLDFSAAGLTSLSLGASGSTASTYSGTLWTPIDNVYRLGGGGGTLIFNPSLVGASDSLVVGGNGSGGTVTLVNAGSYGGGTVVSGGIGSGNAAIGTAGGAGLLQTNVLSGTSTTPLGANTSITLDNGALGLGTAGTLTSGQVVNVAGYDLTYSGQNAINLSAGAGSVTLAANTLTRANAGVLMLNPTSGATLGTTEKVTVASGAPVVTNGMVAPSYIDGTTRNFLTYGANGFQDITYSVTGTTDTDIANANANSTVVISNTTFSTSIGGNKAIYALKLVNTSNQYNANAIGTTGETLTLLSGGLILDMTAGGGINFSSDMTRAAINFGTAEAVVGLFGATAALGTSPWLGTGGLTVYGNGSLQASDVLITGGITIAGGTVKLGSSNGLNANNQLTIDKAGTFQFIGTNSQQVLGLSGEGLINNTTNSATFVVDGLTGTGTTVFGGSIQNGSGTVALTKSGLNTQSLTGSNSYTGTTTVNSGTLRLDFSATGAPAKNIINNTTNSSALALTGGKLDIVGAAGVTNSQQFNGLTVSAGSSAIALTAGSGGGTPTVTLGGSFTRNAGGTLDITDATGGHVSTAASTPLTGGVWSTTSSNPTAFATVNGTDWATISGGAISALPSYSTGTVNYTTGNNVDVANGDSVSGVTVNTLRFNAVTDGLTLSGTNTISTGGILVTSAATGASISGGTLKSNTGNEVVIINNGQLAVSSVIANGNAASALTLSGSGTTTLNAANTFTGNAYINSGTVIVGNAAAFGTTAGTLNLNGGTLQSSSAVTLNAKAIAFNKNFIIGGVNDLTLSGALTSNSSSSTLTVNNTGATTLSGGVVLSATMNVAGSGNVTASGVVSSTGGLTYAGTGTMTVSNAANTYTGVTKVTSGILSVGTLAAGGSNSSIGKSTNAATNLVMDGGTLQYTGATVSTDHLFTLGGSGGTLDASGTGTLSLSNTGAIGFNNTPGVRTLTLTGSNTGANTLAPVVSDYIGLYATGLTKSGVGQWVLASANTYTGATKINAGTLALASTGSISANSAITVAAGATFDTSAQSYAFSTVQTTTIGIGASSAGLINAAAVTFTGASLTLDFGSTASLLASYNILLNSGSTGDFTSVTATGTSIAGSFVNAGLGNWTLTAGGYNLTLSESSGTLTTASAIPEPSAYAAIFGVLALAGAMAYRRRRSV